MSDDSIKVTVDLSPDEPLATVRLGKAAPAVCKALGVERGQDGQPAVIYLDRFIHRTVMKRVFSGWQPTGAITTILRRI